MQNKSIRTGKLFHDPLATEALKVLTLVGFHEQINLL